MTTIGGSGSFYNNTQAMGGMRPPPRPDPSKLAEDLFSQLDTKGQGYLEKSDLQSAFESSASGSASVDEVFSSLDGDGDGKITKEEMTSGLTKLAEELDSHFNAGRMAEAMGAMPPPPPPPEADSGFTQDELSAQLEEATAAGDTRRSELLDSVIANFDAADSDGDGKVTFAEAMAYQQSQGSGDSADTTSATAGSQEADLSAHILHQIMQLMATYGRTGEESASTLVSTSA